MFIRYCIVAIACLGAPAAGCRPNPTRGNSSEATPTTHADSDRKLVHDFGIIRPGQPYSHRFPIHNTGDKRWTIVRFQTNCACTVGEASASTIEPSQTEFVRIDYTSPSTISDDKKTIGVVFAEDYAPLVWLEIQARVRDAVSPMPERVDLGRRASGAEVTSFFEVHNYDDHDIELGAIRPSEPWLSIGSQSSYRGGGSGEGNFMPRQVWRIELLARPKDLAPGWHRSHIDVEVKGTTDRVRPIEVDLDLAPPVVAIPGMMFFGSAEPGQAASSKILLRVSPEVGVTIEGALALSHDLGDRLALSCTPKSKGYWELSATFTPAATDPRELRGSVDVRFPDGGLSPLKIPVIARIQRR
jgi:uncharacterized protein DUF1573